MKRETINGHELANIAKGLKKPLGKKPSEHYWRMAGQELLGLVKGNKLVLLAENGRPLLGARIAALSEITDETVREAIGEVSKELREKAAGSEDESAIGEAYEGAAVGDPGYLCNDEFEGLIPAAKLMVLERAVFAENGEKALAELKKLYGLNNLDSEGLEMLNPLHLAFSDDPVYSDSDRETRSTYRKKAGMIAKETGIGQERFAFELTTRAKRENIHLGELIWSDFSTVFPFPKQYLYILVLLTAAKVLSISVGLLCGWQSALIAYLPCIGIIKPFIDNLFSRMAPPVFPVPRLELSGNRKGDTKEDGKEDGSGLSDGKEAKTVCVLSALISGKPALLDALERLRQAKIRQIRQQSQCLDNLSFVLLCDLPASKMEKDPKDKEILSSVPSLMKSADMEEAIVIFRKREYSNTQHCWQGLERKRGAITALAKACAGEEQKFLQVCGDLTKIKDAEYIVALDYDTLPLLDSLKELVAAAKHPLNKKYGIFAPRISTCLTSSLKTEFARQWGGCGGVGCISAYDNVSGEFYSDCFDEGIFTGKGLIRVKDFLEKTIDVFPKEWVLSHDILEGGLLGVKYTGDTEFTDSFPSGSKGYFKRQDRWLRGDFQNLRFLFMKKLSPLTKFKLYDNFRRGIQPLCLMALMFLAPFVKNGWALVIAVLLSVFLPFTPSMLFAVKTGAGFGLARQFYSPVFTEAGTLCRKALLELMALPYSGLVSLCAGVKTLWRTLVSKKNLLEWTTSGALEKAGIKGSFIHLIPPFLVSLALLACGFTGKSVLVTVIAVFMSAGLPVFSWLDRERRVESPYVSQHMKLQLMEQAEKMWRFYTDYVTEEDNFLPPDNVQFSPVYRVNHRTSPTNIGMYLLSCVAVRELGIIDDKELFLRTDQTLSTVEKLEKWQGNLYNWYDTNSLTLMSSFVSTVDSGNFICCLIVLLEELKSRKAEKSLISRVDKIISETDLTPFFNKKKRLFSIGYDSKANKLSQSHYDMLMSEARMTSYYAVASGQTDKSHWRSLGRTMSRWGRRAGPVSWTGTMFEFFMPELLLASREGSLSYEALRYALYCQKRRSKPFGVSESGYYAFDRKLNYQYKAHGVQKLGLKGGLDKELVISPYSSFLTLRTDPAGSFNNLVLLQRQGAESPAYGFYEAVDLTSGRQAVVKSHMAHHVGMSIAGTANLLEDNILSRLFLSNERTEAGTELLEERIMTGEKILKIKDEKPVGKIPACEREVFEKPDPLRPEINPLWGGGLGLFTGADGITVGYYKDKLLFRKSTDPLLRPRGQFFGLTEETGEILPLVFHPLLKNHLKRLKKAETVFGGNCTQYYAEDNNLSAVMEISPCGKLPAEIIKFTVKNISDEKREPELHCYFDTILCDEREYQAHPAFADLFLKIYYDEIEGIFLICRTERHGDGETWAAVAFSDSREVYPCFNRENAVTGNDPFSFFNSPERENDKVSQPCPCLYLKTKLELEKGEETSITLFFTAGGGEKQVRENLTKLRAGTETDGGVSPISRSTLQGRFASEILSSLLYGITYDKRILDARLHCESDKRALWRYGISGDHSIILLLAEEKDSMTEPLIRLQQGLALSGIQTDIVILCPDKETKRVRIAATEELVKSGGLFILETENMTEVEIQTLYANAAGIFPKEKSDKPSIRQKSYLLPIKASQPGLPQLAEGFKEELFTTVIGNRPWCHVSAGEKFGTLFSAGSLGFSWAYNSRENKLTPWYNDICQDNTGELLLLSDGKSIYDCVNKSKAVFAAGRGLIPGGVDYYSIIPDIPGLEISVSVRAEREALGKEVTVTLENKGARELKLDLSYYIKPLMAPDGSQSRVNVWTEELSEGEKLLIFNNPENQYYKGFMALISTKEGKFTLSREKLFRGEFTGTGQGTISGSDGCASVTVPLKLPPKEREKIRYILSYRENKEKLMQTVTAMKERSGKSDTANSPLFKNRITIQSPLGNINQLFNYWLPWQTLGCRIWARTGFYQNGGAFGFRDQLQDCTWISLLDPDTARKHIVKCCRRQFLEGDVLHWWHELGETGEIVKGVRTRYSDDLLWLPYAACRYVKYSGDKALWKTEVEYAIGQALDSQKHELFMEISIDEKTENVYRHCKRAMEKGYTEGSHGLLLMGCGDWNDGYNKVGLGGKGESVWLSMFYIICCRLFAAAARENDDAAYGEELENRAAKLSSAIEENCWDGEYYIRAFYDDGSKMGSKEKDSCQIDLLPQAFAVLCGLPDRDRNVIALNSALSRLVDRKNSIIKLFDPPFVRGETSQDPGYVASYPAGIRENGGQYTHGAVWLALACFKAGMKEEGLELIKMLSPADRDIHFGNEPFAMTADIYSGKGIEGRGGWSLYTGAAGWYWGCLLEGLFGISVNGKDLTVSPRLTKEIDNSTVTFEMGENGDRMKITFKYREDAPEMTKLRIEGDKEIVVYYN